MRKRKWLMLVAVVVATTVMAVVGASVYMLDYSLAPDPNRRDVDSCYQQLLAEYPECGEWKDRRDVMEWMKVFRADTMVVHGVSMGAATTMMLSGETMPEGIKDLRFVADCGYTSVWDEFAMQLKAQFGLPAFPLMYTTSLLCRLRYGWRFDEASAIAQVRKCRYPMLFIHGDNDTFVPTRMVYPLYAAKAHPKRLWISQGAEHARAYQTHKEEYIRQLRQFLR